MACDQAVLVYTQGTIVFANDVALALLGATERGQVVGLPIGRFFSLSAGEAGFGTRSVAADFAEANITRLDSSEVATVTLMLIPCHYGGKESLQILVRDRRVRQTLEGRVSYLVRNDILTDLPNRIEFHDRLIGAMSRSKQNQRQVAVIRLDLDYFRTINRQCGNAAGDSVLREIAARIRNSVRPTDTVARVTGDGFGVILEGLEHRDQASVVINRILANLSPPVVVAGVSIIVGATAGIAAHPGDALGIDALLHAADTALHFAQASARGGFRFYFPEMEVSSTRDKTRRDEKNDLAARLTHREREVMFAVVEGHSTKTIADKLGTSPRTIESHRARVMEKMEAESLVDLVRMVMDLKK